MTTQTSPGYIDVHHHVFPPFFIALTEAHAAPVVAIANDGQRKGRAWTPANSLKEMDDEGTAVSITTIASPDRYQMRPDANDVARRVNEYQAELVRDYPGRFGMFATLPLNDMDASLKEIEYVLDVLNADGIYLQTRFQKKLLGDPFFHPILEELNRRKALLYTHPTVPDFCKGLNPEVPDTVIEITVDTTRAIASLLFTGVAARFQDLNIIWSHGGGTMPIIIDRFHEQEAKPYMAEKLPNGLLHELHRFYYDTAQSHRPGPFGALRAIVPISQFVFGTDHPFRTPNQIAAGLAQCGLTPAELKAIAHGNIARLLPRYDKVGA